jgi:hypothetical protein
MPPKWWSAAADFDLVGKNNVEGLKETLRIMMQFTHYHMLLRIHLPFLLENDSRYEYSIMVAANASRAIMGHYIAFRRNVSGLAYCRGIDFISLNAVVSSCLAHMSTHIPTTNTEDYASVSAQLSLGHQRPVDRGMMEETLDIMEDMATVYDDAIAKQIVQILKPLLEVEQASANGQVYLSSLESKAGHNDADGASGRINARGGIEMRIPHFGAITIQRNTVNSSSKTGHTDDGGSTRNKDAILSSSDEMGARSDACTQDDVLQGVDLALFDDLGLDWAVTDSSVPFEWPG